MIEKLKLEVRDLKQLHEVLRMRNKEYIKRHDH